MLIEILIPALGLSRLSISPTKKEKAEHKTQRSYSIQDLPYILYTKNTRRPLENGEVPTTCKCCCGKMEVWGQTNWMAWRRLLAKGCLCGCHIKYFFPTY